MKITITSNVYVLTSDIKASDIELLKRHNPAALTIKDADGNDVFSVNYKEGSPDLQNFGITFGAKTLDDDGKVVVTGNIPAGIDTKEAAKGYVADRLGAVVGHLKTLEGTVPAAAAAVRDARKALVDSISVN